MTRAFSDPSARILALRFRLLGDIILTTPALRLLRDRFPNATIDYVAEPEFDEVLRGLPSIDEVVRYDRARIKNSVMGAAGIAFARSLRGRSYDVAIDLHGGPRSALQTLASGAPLRIGYSGPHGVFCYNSRIPRRPPGGRIHSVLQQLRLLAPLGIHPGQRIPCVEMAEPGGEAHERAERLVARARESGCEGIAAIHVPSANPFRNWGVERIAGVARGVAALGLRPVFVGGADGESVYRQMVSRIGVQAVSLLAQTTPLELRAVVARSRVFIGVDSGPMHVAATTPTPIVAVFGPNVPETSGPWTDRATIVQEAVDCRPCDQSRCVYGDYRCFGRLDSDRIVGAVERWVKADLSPRPRDLPASLYGNAVSG
ncbi:MAG: glycosyltransferase family 9 protein [Acidobacteria bacterium]|nr:glycosyltransferase family 9 protein [Acidobacteriota bacterium]